jgi:hypothetical protein
MTSRHLAVAGSGVAQPGKPGADKVFHQDAIDFPVNLDVKAILKKNKTIEPRFEVFHDKCAPWRKRQMIFAGGQTDHILTVAVTCGTFQAIFASSSGNSARTSAMMARRFLAFVASDEDR